MAKLGNKQVCKILHTVWLIISVSHFNLVEKKKHPYSASFKNYMIPLEIPTLLGNVVIVFEYMLW